MSNKQQNYNILFQVRLLRANDAAWTAQANIPDDLCSCHVKVLHDVATDEGSCPTKTRLAMNCNGPCVREDRLLWNEQQYILISAKISQQNQPDQWHP